MFLTPQRLIAAGIHSPIEHEHDREQPWLWPLLTNSSTYSTQPTAIAALPAHAVIQYDQAFAKPQPFPNATRA